MAGCLCLPDCLEVAFSETISSTGGIRKGRSLPTRDADPTEPQALVALTSKTPWPPAWPCRPLSLLHPSSCRWAWCCWTYYYYRWNPFWRFLRTSRGTSCLLLQSYPLCDRTTFLPVLWFATGILPDRGSPQSVGVTCAPTPIRIWALPHSPNCLEDVFSETGFRCMGFSET